MHNMPIVSNVGQKRASTGLSSGHCRPQSHRSTSRAGRTRDQVKYLSNVVEQDHRFIKRLVKPGMGFFSFESAWRTLRGYEAMHMIRKGQMQGVNKRDITGQVTFIAHLFGVAA